MNHHVLRGLYRTGQPVKNRFSLHVCFFSLNLHVWDHLRESNFEGEAGVSAKYVFKSPHHVTRDPSTTSFFALFKLTSLTLCSVYIYTHIHTGREYTLSHYSFRPSKWGGILRGREHYSWWPLFVGRLVELAMWGMSVRLGEERGVIW